MGVEIFVSISIHNAVSNAFTEKRSTVHFASFQTLIIITVFLNVPPAFLPVPCFTCLSVFPPREWIL